MQDEARESKIRWGNFCRGIGASGDPDTVFADLLKRYSEPHRHYHNINHIVVCLRELDEAAFLCQHPDAVEMAVWFHDAIYQIPSSNNEELSAHLARQAANKMGLGKVFGFAVAELILTTKTHQAQIIDQQILSDIDLAIFGQSEEVFDEYEANIRREYVFEGGPYTEEQFLRGRIVILEGFQKRDRIYSTDFFRDKYEVQARENLKRSIVNLEARVG